MYTPPPLLWWLQSLVIEQKWTHYIPLYLPPHTEQAITKLSPKYSTVECFQIILCLSQSTHAMTSLSKTFFQDLYIISILIIMLTGVELNMVTIILFPLSTVAEFPCEEILLKLWLWFYSLTISACRFCDIQFKVCSWECKEWFTSK